MGRGGNTWLRIAPVTSAAVLLLAACGTATTTTGSRTEVTAVYTPTERTLGPPTRVSTRDRLHTPDPSGPCPPARPGSGIEPVEPCTVVVRRGEGVPVLLRTPYQGIPWRIQPLDGTSVRVDDVDVAGNGDTRFVLTAVRPGDTVISAYVPGPHEAPAISETFTATVPR
jgi:hypothetical protein